MAAACGSEGRTLVSLLHNAIDLAEAGWVPDPVVRWGIRRACAERLRHEARRRHGVADHEATAALVRALGASPVAPAPAEANVQHYEVPAAFFRHVLGPRLKYSCAFWDQDISTLTGAEIAALDQTIARAAIEDGHRILELGCGWGSLALEMATRFPHSTIVAISNSTSQRRHVETEVRRRGLTNLTIETADINNYAPDGTFDRVISVEMFEHLRNYEALFARIGGWLAPRGRLFVHVFCHRRFAYPFETEGPANWMGRHFFAGGLMPSLDLLPAVPSPLTLEATWQWSGTHYARTANAWLANLDAAGPALARLLSSDPDEGRRALGRWRLFFLACAELFATRGGTEWGVAHYRFAR
jgi:cyclopropane-fatty-acyl-phospholipid synthase